MATLLDEFKHLLDGYHALKLTQYMDLSAGVVLSYYHLTTIDKEIELVWAKQWSLGKLLFLILRYYTIGSIVYQLISLLGPTASYNQCRAWIQWQAFDSCFVFFLTEMVLQLRIYAMYNKSKKILALMTVVFILSLVTSVGLLIADIRISGYTFLPLKPVNICTLTNWRPSFVYILSFIISDALLVGLALYRGYLSMHDYKFRRRSAPGILEILINDSIYYFLAILAVYLAYMLVWITDNLLFDVLSGYSITAPTVMCEHLIFHMQEKFEAIEECTELDSEYSGAQHVC